MTSSLKNEPPIASSEHRAAFVVFGMAETLPADRFPPPLRIVFDYWRRKAGNRVAPRRQDLDPIDIPRALANVMLWDVADNGESFICRLAGTIACDTARRELRGKTLEAMPWEPAQAAAEFRSVASTLMPYYVERRLTWAQRSHENYQRLLLPLSEDQRQATMLLAVLYFS